MAELPTKEDLEKLYHEKGHDALVWYAWRNALRALTAIGGSLLFEVGHTNTVSHVYAICRVSLMLSRWKSMTSAPNINIIRSALISAEYTKSLYADYAYDYIDNYADGFAHTDYYSFDDNDAASDSCAKATAAVAVTSAAASAAASVTSPYDVISAAYSTSTNAALVADDADIREDFIWISQQAVFQWTYLPLWLKGEKPLWIRQAIQLLHLKLQRFRLDFLAKEIVKLWEGIPLDTHSSNYWLNLSDVITNDAAALHRSIFSSNAIEEVHAVRVLLLGAGGAGKSSLKDRLQGSPVEITKKVTVGVDYLQYQTINLCKTFPDYRLTDKKLDLFLWDFGGQTIFHGLHSAFLHENCVYVLVVDSRHEQAPDEWLHQIRHLAGSQAKVLLVTNWYEQCETHQNKTRLLREFSGLLMTESFFYFSCLNKDAPDFKRFMQSLVNISLDSQKMVLKETLDVQRELEKQYQDTVFLHDRHLKKLIRETTQRDDAANSTINQLNQLGFLVRVVSGQNQYCLKPSWAVDNAYQLLYADALRKAGGIADMTMLEQALENKTDVAVEQVSFLVDFLKERALCCDLGNGRYFFPDAAPADEPPTVANLLGERSKLTLRFDLPYLPLGFHARLVHELFKPNSLGCIETTDEIWRQGFILRTRDTPAVVQYLLRKSSIELVMVGEQLRDYADLLRVFYTHLNTVIASGNGIKPHEIHPSVRFSNGQLFSVHSSAELIGVLKTVKDFETLIMEVSKMSGKVNNYYGSTHNEGDGQFATNSKDVTMNQFVDKSHHTINADQRQQIANIIGALLKDAGSLAPTDLIAVAKVNEALAAPQDKPESRNLLGKVWHGLKEVLDVTKTTTEIGGFALEHQAAITGAITTAVAALT